MISSNIYWNYLYESLRVYLIQIGKAVALPGVGA